MKKILYSILAVLTVLCAACDDHIGDSEVANAPYVAALGITSSGNTTYYVVSAEDLMTGNINAIGKGIEQNGYHDYQQAGNTIFCIGGLGVTQATGVTRGADGLLAERGSFVFNDTPDGFCQVDDNTMLALEIPSSGEAGTTMTFYTVDTRTLAITSTVGNVPVAPLCDLDWPTITGMEYSNGQVYVTYTPMNPSTFQTPYTDTMFVAVYSYPDMQLQRLIKDDRHGPAGSWSAFNGIIKDERGDLYLMSSSALANGYSQCTRPAGFLRIPAGDTAFDAQYDFNFDTASGGLKPAHATYIGEGLVFAEVSTLNPQTADDRWSDRALKCCIIDLYNQRVIDVPEIPVHNGNGGRRFAVLVEGRDIYLPVSSSDGLHVYRTTVTGSGETLAAHAVRGAKISATFVGGLFKL